MTKHFLLKIASLALFVPIFFGAAKAQSDLPKTEVGAFLTTIDLRDSVGEKPLGVGGRLTYNLNDNFAIDGEVSYFPENPAGNFGQTAAFAGVRAGVRTEKIGVFAKARPGAVRFGGDFFGVRNGGSQTKFAFDAGGVLEFYPSRRVIVRIDVGDTIIPFGDDRIFTGASINPVRPGTTHNLQASFGIGFRF